MNLLLDFILAFAVEFLIIFAFIRKDFWKGILYVFLINLFSWSIAILIYGEFGFYFLVELGVVLVESVLIMLLFELRFWKGLMISFAANLTSTVLGFLILF